MHFLSLNLFIICSFSEFSGNVVQAVSVVYQISSLNIGQRSIYETYDILKYAINLGPYGLTVETNGSFVFQVKSCRDTSVYLSNSPNLDSSLPFYSIYLGGGNNIWSAIRIRKQSLNATVVVNGTHLKSTEYRPFWISWSRGLVQFGNGSDVGYNVLKEYQDPTPFAIMGMGISTGYGADGEWRIPVTISDTFNGFFTDCQRMNKRVDSYISSSTSLSRTGCGLLCSSKTACIGFNYRNNDGRCEVISPPESNLTTLPFVELNGWQSFFKCYNETRVCIGCFL